MTPIDNAIHLCVDMQRIFSHGGLWETPWMERVLPTIAAIAARCPERTVFTRFVTPASPEDVPGQWQAYFRRWKRATREMLDPVELELVPELARYVPPAAVVDKRAYSAFFRSPLAGFLLERKVQTVVVSGAETDVCVLSTVLDAVNIGFRVVIVEDALCSSSDEGHDALMLGKPARGKKCDAIEGIIDEGKEIMEEYADTQALDAGLLAAAQAVEHYEISRYGTLKAWAGKLNLPDAVKLLDQTLVEEKKTDEALSKLAEKAVNYEAAA